MSTEPQPLPIVCTLDEATLAARREGDIATFLATVTETRELPDGYELTLPGDPATIRNLTEFIINERNCCRFFTFETAFAPNAGDITLRLRGPEGTKQLLTEMGLPSAKPAPHSNAVQHTPQLSSRPSEAGRGICRSNHLAK